MNQEKILFKELSYKIIGIAMQVHNELGHGFLEKVYENAMMVLFRKEGIKALKQAAIAVTFLGETVGDYFADILVEDKIIVELKSIDRIADIHRAQALNYLKATGLELAIILNFSKAGLSMKDWFVKIINISVDSRSFAAEF